ncbi:MAG: hypothetical protein HYV03_05450 [Deltaproteobacteria bacterium]|nr:hypothetical protein [Deltaproteobacteria bacterium]
MLEAFEWYFLGRAYLDGVSFLVVDDPKKRNELLSRGEVEQVYSFGGESFIAEDNEYIQIPTREMRVYVLSFNTTKPPFDNREARKAFRCALNFQNIQNYLHVYLRFVTRLPKPAGEMVIHEVRRAVASLGFELTIDDKWPTLEQELSQGVNADIFFIGYAPNFSDSFFLLNYFHSASIGSTNGARFREERYDALLDAAVRTEDYSARARLYRELNRLLVDEVVVIPVYSGSANTGVFKKYIRGLEFPYANLPFPLLERVWLNS